MGKLQTCRLKRLLQLIQGSGIAKIGRSALHIKGGHINARDTRG